MAAVQESNEIFKSVKRQDKSREVDDSILFR